MPRPLTGRELEVEALFAEGRTGPEIAARLGVCLGSVAQARRRALVKRGVSRAALTPRRRELVRVIWALAKEKGAWPTWAEACAAFGVTKNAISSHVVVLHRLGLVAETGEGGKARLQLCGVELRIADTPEGARLKEILGE